MARETQRTCLQPAQYIHLSHLSAASCSGSCSSQRQARRMQPDEYGIWWVVHLKTISFRPLTSFPCFSSIHLLRSLPLFSSVRLKANFEGRLGTLLSLLIPHSSWPWQWSDDCACNNELTVRKMLTTAPPIRRYMYTPLARGF